MEVWHADSFKAGGSNRTLYGVVTDWEAMTVEALGAWRAGIGNCGIANLPADTLDAVVTAWAISVLIARELRKADAVNASMVRWALVVIL